jgi:hypothetical protein
MKDLSTTMKAEEAIALLQGFQTEAEILAFIAGEDRKTVINAAEDRRKALPPSKPKAGEVKGPITQDTSDFKEGVQKTKSYVTCEDVVDKMRKAGKKI